MIGRDFKKPNFKPASECGGIALKKIAALAAALLTAAALLGGCAARTAVSPEEFQKKAEGLSYTVQAQTPTEVGAEKTLSAAKKDSDAQVSFIVFDTAAHAAGSYSALRKSMPSKGGQAIDSDAYNKFTVTNGEIYYVLIRMDNTVLNCTDSVSKQKETDDLVSALKY